MEAITLYELNNLVRGTLETVLERIYWIQAELSEARLASNGHFYVEFVQKDARGQGLVAKARGVLWSNVYRLLAPAFERETGQTLRAGLKVMVQVAVSFHELYGYSLVVTDIDPAYTLGDLARRRKEILRQLAAEGILDDNRELPLPALLNRVAVISSAGAAGYGDFCRQLQDNAYGFRFHTRLFPAVMQGAKVEESVLAALDAVLASREVWDIVVIIRGGGATSDLSDFDTYLLAAACAQFPLPVLVGIGHDRDETVLDRVAHTRVKTPTAAAAFLIDHQHRAAAAVEALQQRLAEAAAARIASSRQQLERLSVGLPGLFVRVREEQEYHLNALARRLLAARRQATSEARHRLERAENKLSACCRQRLQEARHRLDGREERLRHALSDRLAREQFRLRLLGQQCEAANPERLLRRGYSLTLREGRPVMRAADLHPGDEIVTRLAEGEVRSVVK